MLIAPTHLASRKCQMCHSSLVGVASMCSMVTSPILLATTFVTMSSSDLGPRAPRGVNKGYGRRRDQLWSRWAEILLRGNVHSLKRGPAAAWAMATPAKSLCLLYTDTRIRCSAQPLCRRMAKLRVWVWSDLSKYETGFVSCPSIHPKCYVQVELRMGG